MLCLDVVPNTSPLTAQCYYLMMRFLQLRVEIGGFEPPTSCMPCKRSSQLSYIPMCWLPKKLRIFVDANINGLADFAKFILINKPEIIKLCLPLLGSKIRIEKRHARRPFYSGSYSFVPEKIFTFRRQ
jgi:hypothetical protein